MQNLIDTDARSLMPWIPCQMASYYDLNPVLLKLFELNDSELQFFPGNERKQWD
jgi:hypothetical protein